MFKFKRICVIVVSFLVLFVIVSNNSANAMDFVSVKKIVRYVPNAQGRVQELNLQSSTGENLNLEITIPSIKTRENIKMQLQKDKGLLGIFSKTKNYLSLETSNMNYVDIYEIQGENPHMKFWCITSQYEGTLNTMTNFWLIGPYGTNNYVTYLTMDSLKNMGWDATYLDIYGLQNKFLLEGKRVVYGDLGRQIKLGQRYFVNWDSDAKWFSLEYISPDFDLMNM